MPSLPAPIVIHILRATETSSRVQRFKTFSSFLDGENGPEAELLDVTVAKFTPVNTDGESGEPTYIISNRSVESKRTLYTSLIEELEGLTSNYPNRFKVYYVLNPVATGRMDKWRWVCMKKKMIQDHLPAPSSDIKILRCGPPPTNKAMAAHLEALGHESDMLFQF
uniref:Oxidoreductase FAD/NAD(P)-binding domain-containing protein n=1 Tax=Lactuca sativa TaxID=4236 RepID=A0A9R1WH75_LACSA|nr:hypothetical protein LSAT_V11C100003160 [Lactuca sativa]